MAKSSIGRVLEQTGKIVLELTNFERRIFLGTGRTTSGLLRDTEQVAAGDFQRKKEEPAVQRLGEIELTAPSTAPVYWNTVPTCVQVGCPL
jgi:hypothetical protein